MGLYNSPPSPLQLLVPPETAIQKDELQSTAENEILARAGRAGPGRRAGAGAGLRVCQVGPADAVPGLVGEPEAPGDREAGAVEAAVRAPGATHGGLPVGGHHGRRFGREDHRWLARPGEAHVLLLRVRAEPPLPAGPEAAWPLPEGLPLLQDVGAELPAEEVPWRPALRERPMRAPYERRGRGPGGLPGSVQGVHELENPSLPDKAAGGARGPGLPLLQGPGLEHDHGSAHPQERCPEARVATRPARVLRVRERPPPWHLPAHPPVLR